MWLSWKNVGVAFSAVFILILLTACDDEFSQPVYDGPESTDTSDTDDTGAGTGTAQEGEDCAASSDCLPGLACSGVDQTCQTIGADGTVPADGPCFINQNCQAGMVCASTGTCQTTGEPGTGLAGDDCGDVSDCIYGLLCESEKCTGIQPVFWSGVTCEPADTEAPFEAYFDVERESGEFYRLPFPNDAAVVDGQIDLTGHANPGVLIAELGNPVDDWFKMIEEDLDGFGTNSMVYFRISQPLDYDTVKTMETAFIINITPGSAGYGEMAWTGYAASTGGNLYMCPNWVGLKPSVGNSLDGGTTYAAILTTGIKDRDGHRLAASDSFTAMLGDTAPAGTAMKNAWNAYAPLRQAIADDHVDGTKVAVASVFTTQTRMSRIPSVRDRVRLEDTPSLVDGDLAADTGNAGFTLYSGRVTVPFYQKGERPFKTVGDGAISFNSNDRPVLVETEPVRFALSIPDGTAPVAGWPIFFFAHGTGGSETSFVDDGVAKIMADMGIAVISLEQVMHGDRRGVSGADADLPENSPEQLNYNFRNPWAARDNQVQAAADYFQAVRFIENYASITGETAVFDPAKFYFFGHSQGTQGQFLFAVHEPLIKGILLSGAGGLLMETILGKTKPVNLVAAAKIAFMDPQISNTHPMLNLMQAAMDMVDPVNHRYAAFRNGFPDRTYPHRDMFMSWGIGDSYTPENTQIALAKSLNLHIAPVGDHTVDSLPQITSYPYSDSHWLDYDHLTCVTVQYNPDDDYDGHFVMFNHARALNQWPRFVETMVADDTIAELIRGN